MKGKLVWAVLAGPLAAMLFSCTSEDAMKFTGATAEVKLMTLDPGHFHAALVQKTMYDQVSPEVHVYAPDGPDARDHARRIEGFNTREVNPTHWNQVVCMEEDYLEKMTADGAGNMVVISGNNQKKAEYIKACVAAGLNVLADKPMCIDGAGYKLLEDAFEIAREEGVLLYDIMTERSEITSILQKALIHDEDVFGVLVEGSPDKPSVIKESVHHFFKYVAGNPLKRPAWFFDTTQQGEGIVDVTSHLIDLVMWGCFPGKIIDYERDIRLKAARRWPTVLKPEQFEKVTRLKEFPDYLQGNLNAEGDLACYSNGEIVFAIKGVNAKVTVVWNYKAPEGGGDTHFSMMQGTKAEVTIRQGKEQNFKPELYVAPAGGRNPEELGASLDGWVAGLQGTYPGVALKKQGALWQVIIPDAYRIGHEAHFRQVMVRYLDFLVEGKMPEWEIPNMITKYRLTSTALSVAK